MSVLPKPTPEKHCSYCGKKMERQRYKSKLEDLGAFMRRKYCCRECMRKGFIKSGEVTDQDIKAAHASSRKIPFTIQGKERRCEMCGATDVRIEVHHKDKNWKNNNPDNLQVLCASCHRRLHLVDYQTLKCKYCDNPANGGRGMCNKHYIQWRLNGDPLHKPWSTYKEKKSKGQINVYDKQGNLIKTYADVRTASKESGYARSSVTAACNTPGKTLGGYIWKYAD